MGPLTRTPRAIGFDDAPFALYRARSVTLLGAVCSGTRFEGLVRGTVRRDGWNANAEICRLLVGGKFLRQLHCVLLDGIAFGGFNVVDLPALAKSLQRPCIAVMRRLPRMHLIEAAAQRVSRPHLRLSRMRAAGEIHVRPPFVFQVQGASPEMAHALLVKLTDRGHVPECLRLAHLIGGALVHGESGRRA